MKNPSSAIAKAARNHVIPRLGITNELLYRLCKQLLSKDFYGVFSADDIPNNLAAYNSFIIIVNIATKKSTRAGHFVTIVGNSSTINYIDSYGLPCLQPHIKSFLALCYRKICYNTRQIQSFNSKYCGLYALLFACYFDKENNEGNDFQLLFHNNRLKQNDKLCSTYLTQMI